METTDVRSGAAVAPRRRRFGLSLRVTLGLVVLIAVALGGWVHRIRELRAATALIRQHQGSYLFDFEYDPATSKFIEKPQSWAPDWLRSLVGEESLHDVTYLRIVDSTFTDADFKQITRLFPKIACMGVDNSAITNQSLARLRGNQYLKGLFVKDRQLTDAGMDLLGIETLPQLSLLDVRATQVSEAKVHQMNQTLVAREAAAKRAKPNVRGDSHFIMSGRFGSFESNVQSRADYEQSLIKPPAP